MEPRVTLTVVVPTYRRPDRLGCCLEGIAAQTRPPEEVVVVVRASDAASREVLARRTDLPLRLVEPGGPGLVPAIHAGLSAVVTDVAVVADDDTVAAADWLERYERSFVDGVAAVGGFNQVWVDGREHRHRSAGVGRLSWAGRLTGMHYARSGLRQVDVEHLQGCNMAFRVPCPLPDTALRGDGSFYELDMCLRAASTGRIVYDERIAVDHHLAGRADRDGAPVAGALAARSATARRQVADSCWNYAYVLAKNTDDPLQRSVRLGFGLLVGQRRLWGLARVAVEAVRHPSPAWAALLGVATRNRLAGWRAGRRAARRPATV